MSTKCPQPRLRPSLSSGSTNNNNGNVKNNNNNSSKLLKTAPAIPRCSCKFVYTLLLISVSFVVCTALLVYFLSYAAINSTIAEMQSSMRSTLAAHVKDAVESHLNSTLSLLNNLAHNTKDRFPNLPNQFDLVNYKGGLADFSFFVQNNRDVSTCGFGTSNKLYARASLGPSISTAEARVYGIRDINAGSRLVYYHHALDNMVINSTANPNLPNHREAINGRAPHPSLNYADFNSEDVLTGLKWYDKVEGYDNTLTHWWNVAVNIPKGDSGWSPVSKLLGPLAGISAITAVKQVDYDVYDYHSNSTTAANATVVVFSQVYLKFINAFLSKLFVGNSGFIAIVERNGNLIATSSIPVQQQYDDHNYNNIWQLDDPQLLAVSYALTRAGFIDTKATPDVIYSNDPWLISPIADYTLSAHDATHMTAVPLAIPGLRWTVVIITSDNEFNGNLAQTSKSVLGAVIAIIVGAIICITLATQFISKPMMNTAEFMATISRAGLSKKDGADKYSNFLMQSVLFNELLQKWKASYAPAETKEKKSSCCQSLRLFAHLISNFAVAEVKVMRSTLEEMVQNMTQSYSELEAMHQAKQHFVRYIFHEVRVPFNAIVLGIDQLQVLLKNPTPIMKNHSFALRNQHIEKTAMEQGAASAGNTPKKLLLATLGNSGPGNIAAANSDDIKEILDILHSQSKVVSMILGDVLSLQKIEESALQLDYAPFCFECMLLRTIRSFQAEVDRRSLKLFVILPVLSTDGASFVGVRTVSAPFSIQKQLRHSHFYCVGDRYRLRQVVSNYCSNAIKFSHEGGEITVKVSYEMIPSACPEQAINTTFDNNAISRLPLQSKKVLCNLSVIDMGRGITEEEAALLFKPYAQLHLGKKQGSKGTGLGLSICKSLVELHGGVVGVNSEPGKGSQFYFEVPLQVHHSSASSNNNLRSLEEVKQGKGFLPVSHDISRMATDSSEGGPTVTPLPSPCPLTDLHPVSNKASQAWLKLQQVDVHVNSPQITPGLDSSEDSDPEDNFQHRKSFIIDIQEHSKSGIIFHEESQANFDSLHTRIKVELAPLGVNNFTLPPVDFTARSLSEHDHEQKQKQKPLQQRRTHCSGASAGVSSAALSTIAPVYKPRILVAEDSEPSKKLLMMLLRSLQFDCEGVDNGWAAVLKFVHYNPNVVTQEENQDNRSKKIVDSSQHMYVPGPQAMNITASQMDLILDPHNFSLIHPPPFDLVLIDGSMPVMSGIQATRLMRQLGVGVPIIAVTGNALAEDQAEFMLSGINDFLTKPVQKKRLISVLADYNLTPSSF
jgi:signal transduction histidine kinase